MSNRSSTVGEWLKKAVGVEGSFKEAIMPMIGYNSASILFGGAGYIISIYFLAFLTEVEGLSPKQAGKVILVAQLWDAVIDPVLGILTDRTRSKYGKHRKYILLGIAPIAVTYFMLWNSFGISAAGNAKYTMIYYIIAYMLFNTAYSIIIVPHTSMLPEQAPEYFLRTQYKSVEYIMNSVGMISSFLLVSLSLGFVNMDVMTSQMRGKFAVLGLILCLWFSLPLIYTFKSTHEPSSLDMHVPKMDLKLIVREYALVLKNKAFRRYFLISLFYMMCRGFYSNSNNYFIRYIAKRPGSYNIMVSIAGVAEASGFPLNYALTKKYGKQKCGILLAPAMIAGILMNFLINDSLVSAQSLILGSFHIDWTIVVLVAAIVLYYFGYSGVGFVATNLQPDVTDIDELITGRRREGVISAFNSLVRQSVNGLMAGFSGFILDGFGLVTGKGTLTQTLRAQRGLKLTYIVLPAIFAVLSYLSINRYKMTREQHEMIMNAIAQKHEKGYAELTDDQIRQIEDIAGQKFEDMWIGQPEKIIAE